VLTLLLAAVAAVPALAAPTAAAGAGYRVKAGDTLSGIAARLGVSAAALTRVNRLADPNRIVAGRLLSVPGRRWGGAGAGGRYRVKAGDTLSGIAARLGVSTGRLARANRLANPNLIAAGRLLAVPGAHAAEEAVAQTPVTTVTSYRVRPGDTLSGIAARLGVSAGALASANGLANPNQIVAGALLEAPGAANAPADAPSGLPPVPGWVDPAVVPGLIAASAARHGVDPALVRAVAWQESGWQQAMRSPVGALGVMQIMPETADWLGPALLGRTIDAGRIEDNVEAGAIYLAWLLRQAGNVRDAVAGYYQGLRSVRERGMYTDTQAYVANVLSLRGRV
jgi:N-acetylmuramoyl-L-alanine amidase